MKNVRWAQAALLAVVLPACAHTSSGQVANASNVEAQAGHDQSAQHDGALAANGVQSSGQPTRRVYLASGSGINEHNYVRTGVVADGVSCDAWSADPNKQCDISHLVARSISHSH